MIILGWILMVIGVLFILVSLAGAFSSIVKRVTAQKTDMGVLNKELIEVYTKLVNALSGLLAELFKGPQWFLAFVLGLVLIYIGARLQAGQSIF